MRKWTLKCSMGLEFLWLEDIANQRVMTRAKKEKNTRENKEIRLFDT